MSGAGSLGRSAFVARHGLRDQDAAAQAAEVVKRVRASGLATVRIAFADQHGILRGKTVMAADIADALENGVAMTTTLLLKDTSHRTVFPVWRPEAVLGLEALRGASDFIMVPDPSTFQILPWSTDSGWILSDLYFPDGQAVPLSTRQVGRAAVNALSERGITYRTGLEIELHVMRLLDPRLAPADATHPATPPDVELLAHGYQYLTEARYDELEPVMELIRETAAALGLPVRSMEVEFGPSQIEFTFHPVDGLAQADNMVLFRSAVKQVCRRHGYHATFMCRPALANLFSSGWHLHQSLVDSETGANLMTPDDNADPLSRTGRHFVAGLLEHAGAACLFTTPTINGYKRYRPYTLAPDRVHWGRDNKAAMLRVIGGPGDAGTRIENRVAEPAANPYLYYASQIQSGLDGLDRNLEPPEPSEAPYETEAPPLPSTLMEAIGLARRDSVFREAFGEDFIHYIATIKEAEIARFMSEVTDWEHREYFEIF
ncbi:MAG: glutamine synthetase family protein [Gammaproteobacteria bacterium]|nr:glutamine synthetase family protein [Gammaproteobacteria bacterium]